MRKEQVMSLMNTDAVSADDIGKMTEMADSTVKEAKDKMGEASKAYTC